MKNSFYFILGADYMRKQTRFAETELFAEIKAGLF